MLAPGQDPSTGETGKDCRWITLSGFANPDFRPHHRGRSTALGATAGLEGSLVVARCFPRETAAGLLLLASVAACLAALAPAWHTRRERRVPWEVWRYRYLLCWLLAPLLLTLALSLIKPLFVPRYFIFCLPALLLLVARGLSRLRSAPLQATALLFVLIFPSGEVLATTDGTSTFNEMTGGGRHNTC